jgi:hypothetical protein
MTAVSLPLEIVEVSQPISSGVKMPAIGMLKKNQKVVAFT